MAVNHITKKFMKIIAWILGVIALLLVCFHFWFINHAEQLIEDLVDAQSNGKLKLQVQKFKFNWFSNKMELRNAVFYSTDTATASTAYRFKVENIKLQVKEILPLVFDKKILIDSLQLINPNISVTRLRSVKDTSASSDTSLSLPQEMGRIYNSIQDALQVLKVNRFQIDNGTFSLINKIKPDEKPIVISRLNFHLDNLQVDTSIAAGDQKILFSDNVSLQTTHQDILFPDGRHRLSFSNFRVNILKKLVEFDSCTVVATKGDSSTNSFSVFFDKLRMTNINFDTLYHAEVIKADSVYCFNPRFKLDVELEKRTGPTKPPKLNELIQQLTGDMHLAFVVVENGSFDINTIRDERPSSFTSDHNNFELQGLRIKKDAPRPLTVERFAMAIRNYENFLRDSTYIMEFDSILINNNRISLSNFSYKELKNNKAVNTVIMPQLELYGLYWDNLIFEQQLKAEMVTLYQPVINYDLSVNKKQSSKNVFDALAGVGKIMQLSNLNIIEGRVNLFFKNKAQLTLEGATASIHGQNLVSSRQLKAIKQSVDVFNFRKGFLKTGNITAELDDVHFIGSNNQLKARAVHVSNNKDLAITASDVLINSMIIDSELQPLVINGINWKKADIQIASFKGAGVDNKNAILLHDIKGNETNISVSNAGQKMSVFLKTLSAKNFSTGSDDVKKITGLVANGKDFSFSNSQLQLGISKLDLADNAVSTLQNITILHSSANDSASVTIPFLQLSPDINSIINGKIKANDITISKPFIQMQLIRNNDRVVQNKSLPLLFNSITIRQPHIVFSSLTEKGMSKLEWNGKDENNVLQIQGLQVSDNTPANIIAQQLNLSIDDFDYTNTKGKKFTAGEGKLSTQINNIELQKNETGSWDWQGHVTDLNANNFVIDSLGKQAGKLTIQSATLHDLSVSAALLLNKTELMRFNQQFRLKNITGSYYNNNDQYNWFNAAYDKKTKRFSLDSFSYRPALEKDAYLKSQPYQADYITAKTGHVNVGPFDIERYINDTILDIGSVDITNGFLTDFRDKRTPRQPGYVTLLPSGIVKSIPVKLQIDTTRLVNTNIIYEEVNDKNNKTGKITVGRLNGLVTQLRNYNLTATDSLRIRASAYLADTIFTKLELRESYTDTLGGFLMTAQMSPADLTILNPILIPLVSAEIKSGYLDTMTMRVVGREYLAYGEMKMLYHDLKVKVIRNSQKREKSFITGTLNFFANAIVKDKNTDKTGAVFFIRLRDRSAINYLVKMALSGVTSNVGIKKSKRMIRKYRKEIKDRNLPTIQL